MFNIFYPELSGFIQPLSGEYGGYREILENIQYMTGYGVETNILIEVYEKFGLNIMGQVDLLTREHRHQNTNVLSKMSFVIMNTILKRNKNLHLNSNILMKNYEKKNNEFLKNKLDDNDFLNENFILITDANDEVLPTMNNYKKNEIFYLKK